MTYQAKPVVFYDGQCPICSREINHYKHRSGAENIDWIDVANHPELVNPYGLDQTTAMARFHVLDAAGEWRVGAAGFVSLWSNLGGYRHLATLVRTLRLQGLLDWGYAQWLRWRNRNPCDNDACKT